MIYYEGPILKIVIWVKGSQSYYLGALKKESTLKKIQKAFNSIQGGHFKALVFIRIPEPEPK